MENRIKSQIATIHHNMDICASGRTYSETLQRTSNLEAAMSRFELSLLAGMMVHPSGSFTTEQSTSSIQMDWFQEYPM